MTDKPDLPIDDLVALDEGASPEEIAEATRFGDALSALESGRRGLDALPNLDASAADEELLELVSLTQLMRASNDSSLGALSRERQDHLWSSLEVALPPLHTAPSRRRISWGWFIAGFAGALAAAFVIVFVLQSQRSTVPLETTPRGPLEQVALLEVEHNQAQYATELMRKPPEPLGDTRMRTLRRARFDAYRSDVRRHRRGVPGDAL